MAYRVKCVKARKAYLRQQKAGGALPAAARGRGRFGTRVDPVPTHRRCKALGGGRKSTMPSIGFELFHWFVDTVDNLASRLSPQLMLNQAFVIREDLRERAEREGLPFGPPCLNYCWMGRWRREFGVSRRLVTCQYKISHKLLLLRTGVFWRNNIRLRAFHRAVCRKNGLPSAELRMKHIDQKPLWMNTAGSSATLAMKGSKSVRVKENHQATRERFTYMTVADSQDDSDCSGACLFKAPGGGSAMRRTLHVPPNMLLQFQEKGSYRLQDVLEFLEWLLPTVDKVEDSQLIVLDWYSAHLDPDVKTLVERKGHKLLLQGGGTTPFTQVPDTHLHKPLSDAYKEEEMLDLHAQRLVRPHKMPFRTKQKCLDSCYTARKTLSPALSRKGFVETGCDPSFLCWLYVQHVVPVVDAVVGASCAS